MQTPRSVRWLLVLLMLLTVTGCSTRFVYERIDWFVVWRMGGYVTLTGEQKSALKQDVQAQLDDVRANQLPEAAELLHGVARQVESGYVTAEQIDDRYQQMLAQYDDFMLGIVDPSMRFLQSLDDEQIVELFANLEDINQEMYEEYSGRTPEEREKNRNKSAIKSTQKWTGRLSDEQKLILTDALARMDDASEEWISYQREWQSRFRTLIETRPPDVEYRAELTQLFVYPRDLHSEEYRARVEANRQILNGALAELLTGLTDKQRKRMVDELDSLADDLEKLSQYQ